MINFLRDTNRIEEGKLVGENGKIDSIQIFLAWKAHDDEDSQD